MRVLALSPHTDDAEFGCGASLSRLLIEGAAVTVVAFSACERSVPAGLPSDTLRAEFAAAMDSMGIADARVLGFDVRTFPAHRQEVLDALISLRDELSPDLVFCPSRSDIHQDHRVVAEESMRAFRGTSTLGYVLPWNCPTVAVAAWRQVFHLDVNRKLAALAAYKSQAARPYATQESVLAHLVSAGSQAGCRWAEPFEVLRWVS